jgi:RNA polymerase sigma-70 factor, ECF subfamily
MTMETDRAITLPALTDEDIVARVLSGERRLFEALMRRHNVRVFRAARAITGNDHEAEDVMQDAYVRAFEHLGDFRGSARFSTWLTRIAVHEALARVRRVRRFDPLDSHSDELSMNGSSTPSPEEQASDIEMRRVLGSAIDVLPVDFRVVFVLRIVEGMSGAETADCLGIPEETVKTRLHRARLRLQHMLVDALEPARDPAYAFHLTRCDRVVFGVLRRIAAPD